MDHVSPQLPPDVNMHGMLRNYWSIIKPGIIFGNMISVLGGFFLASRGSVDVALLMSTVAGISLVIASACVLNNCLDKDLDRLMVRTRDRVLAKGLITPKTAVIYAFVLCVGGIVLLHATTNVLCLSLVLTGFAIYVVVYSLYLKRHSVYAPVIGSLAGAMPPLAGYCAVNNHFDMGAVILLSIFSIWQIPHFYSIAMFRLDDYAAAAIPVFPVKHGVAATKKQIVVCILAFIVAAAMLTFDGYTGYRYLAVALATGMVWLLVAWRAYRASDDQRWARALFACSIVTIFILSVMMSFDFAIL